MAKTKPAAEIGIFGGSGFYTFLEDAQEYEVKTPYGLPSERVAIGEVAGRRVAFIPRHGHKHQYPPHMINYRANVYAMKKLGVTRIISPAAAGSLQAYVKRGDFVICDQFIDRTRGRKDTFYNGPETTHISGAEPSCPELCKLATDCAKNLDIPVHGRGTVVVIQGPRFSTFAESRWFTKEGWEVINMTVYPECVLALELEMCYVNISLITDYDVGLQEEPSIEPVTTDEVLKVFRENIEKVRRLLLKMIPQIPKERKCLCSKALEGARIG